MKAVALFMAILLFSYIVDGQDSKSVYSVFNTFSGFPNIRDFTMSDSGKEGYITIQSCLEDISVLARVKKTDDKWVIDNILSFSGKYFDLEPFLTKNSLRLYFVSNRPIDESVNKSGNFDIWYVDRESVDSEWGNPQNIGPPINTEYNEFYPSLSQNGNLYFTSDNPSSIGKDDIFCSILDNNEYSEPFSLGDSINTEGYEFNSFIAFDESYIIFSGYNRKDGYGSADLYISFRDKNKKWLRAVNMGDEINSKYMDYCPFVDANTKTLFFTSKRSSLKEINNFKSAKEVLDEINKYENGMSKVYKVSIEEMIPVTTNIHPE